MGCRGRRGDTPCLMLYKSVNEKMKLLLDCSHKSKLKILHLLVTLFRIVTGSVDHRLELSLCQSHYCCFVLFFEEGGEEFLAWICVRYC